MRRWLPNLRDRSRRTRVMWALGGVAAIVGVIALLAIIRVASVARDLRGARDLIEEASAALEDGRIEDARQALGRAQVRLTDANGELYTSVELQLLGSLPVIDRNIDAVKDSVALASQLVHGGRLALIEAKPLESETGKLEVPLARGALPVEAIVRAQRELEALAGALPGGDERPDDALVLPPIRDLQDDLYDEAFARRAQVDVLSRSLDVVADMAGANGPRRYLIAVANSAEMRGSGGMVLSYGVLNGSGGDFTLGAFGRIDDLALDAAVPPASAALPADLRARWFGFDVDRLWRNATVAADFETTTPLLLAMYERATGQTAHGVIQIDPHGLAAVLQGIGPVQVPGIGAIGAENVVPFTLSAAYERFPGIETRSDVLGDVAEAVFRKLVDGQYGSLRPLATALVRAVEGRHLLMSTSVAVQDQLRYFDATGALPDPELGDQVHLTVQNVSANKLDYYVATALTVTGDRTAGRAGQLAVTVTVRNGAPPGRTQPRYVFGPFNEAQEAGVYRGVVSLYLPAGATLAAVEGTPPRDPPSLATEDGRPVVGYTVDLPAGAESTVVLRISLPPRRGEYQLVAVPSPRVLPTALRVDVATEAGKVAGTVELTRTWRFRPALPPLPVGLAG